ncbi:MAG: hypothetical protein HUU35_17765 [Armatimonadetes bacterium]|nr:hypothetical protein [Armatimonadota bacterium]
MTVTPRAVRRFDRQERHVYLTAVDLTAHHPEGFDAAMLAQRLGCTGDEGGRWLRWLRETGDFDPSPAAA